MRTGGSSIDLLPSSHQQEGIGKRGATYKLERGKSILETASKEAEMNTPAMVSTWEEINTAVESMWVVSDSPSMEESTRESRESKMEIDPQEVTRKQGSENTKECREETPECKSEENMRECPLELAAVSTQAINSSSSSETRGSAKLCLPPRATRNSAEPQEEVRQSSLELPSWCY